MAKTLFTGVNVLDCGGGDPYPGEVLVDGNRITVVARQRDLAADGIEVVVGGGNTTLMPGLIESHTHLSIDNTDDLLKIGMIPPEESTLIAGATRGCTLIAASQAV